MSKEYDAYLAKHKANVIKGYEWLKKNLAKEIDGMLGNYPYSVFDEVIELQVFRRHDRSKELLDEYWAYDAYFYGDKESYEVVFEFDKAWLKHIHRNPHHWQHWVLIEDDSKNEEYICIPMEPKYIVEMICDWWSFSWKEGNLFGIFDWYEERRERIKFHPETRTIVEGILEEMKKKLEEDK